jgi:hypothetical protein
MANGVFVLQIVELMSKLSDIEIARPLVVLANQSRYTDLGISTDVELDSVAGADDARLRDVRRCHELSERAGNVFLDEGEGLALLGAGPFVVRSKEK